MRAQIFLFKKIFLLFLVGFWLHFSLTKVAAREANSLTADPNFTTDALSDEGKLWHDRLVRGYEGRQYIDVVSCSQSGDSYAIGRCVGTGINSLAGAIRVTGDPQFVSDVAILMANLRASLKDVWPECEKYNQCQKMTDGYLNFTWKQDQNSSYYGSDWHQMDEQLAHAAVANGARILQANSANHPEYETEVTFWVDYLENHFLKKIKSRANLNVNDTTAGSYDTILNRGISHPDIARVSMFYDLYVLTGKPVYLDVANRKNETMQQTYQPVTLADGTPAMVWRHYSGVNKASGAAASHYCQLLEYASYDLHYILKLHNDGFSNYAADEMMQRLSNTTTHLILPNSDPAGTLIGTVCGRQSFTFPDFSTVFGLGDTERDRPFARWANYWSFHALAKWDASGKILESSDIAFKQWDRNWNISSVDLQNPGLAGMVLMGLGDKAFLMPGGGPPSTPPLEVSPAPSPSADVSPSPTADPTDQPAPSITPIVYPSLEDACRADFNDDNFVDLSDYFTLNKAINATSTDLSLDLDQDGTIATSDLDTLLPLFFTTCQ